MTNPQETLIQPGAGGGFLILHWDASVHDPTGYDAASDLESAMKVAHDRFGAHTFKMGDDEWEARGDEMHLSLQEQLGL